MRRIIGVGLFLACMGFALASVISCGGGGSTAYSGGGDADTLEGHPASDFAEISHVHDVYIPLQASYTGGTSWISTETGKNYLQGEIWLPEPFASLGGQVFLEMIYREGIDPKPAGDVVFSCSKWEHQLESTVKGPDTFDSLPRFGFQIQPIPGNADPGLLHQVSWAMTVSPCKRIDFWIVRGSGGSLNDTFQFGVNVLRFLGYGRMASSLPVNN